MNHEINIDALKLAMRHSIDMSVHHAISRFRDELRADERLVYKIAHAAAQTAIDQFASYCNAELRLIQIDHERRADENMMKAPRMVIE